MRRPGGTSAFYFRHLALHLDGAAYSVNRRSSRPHPNVIDQVGGSMRLADMAFEELTEAMNRGWGTRTAGKGEPSDARPRHGSPHFASDRRNQLQSSFVALRWRGLNIPRNRLRKLAYGTGTDPKARQHRWYPSKSITGTASLVK